jgi:hypothetical protein
MIDMQRNFQVTTQILDKQSILVAFFASLRVIKVHCMKLDREVEPSEGVYQSNGITTSTNSDDHDSSILYKRQRMFC